MLPDQTGYTELYPDQERIQVEPARPTRAPSEFLAQVTADSPAQLGAIGMLILETSNLSDSQTTAYLLPIRQTTPDNLYAIQLSAQRQHIAARVPIEQAAALFPTHPKPESDPVIQLTSLKQRAGDEDDPVQKSTLRLEFARLLEGTWLKLSAANSLGQLNPLMTDEFGIIPPTTTETGLVEIVKKSAKSLTGAPAYWAAIQVVRAAVETNLPQTAWRVLQEINQRISAPAQVKAAILYPAVTFLTDKHFDPEELDDELRTYDPSGGILEMIREFKTRTTPQP